MHDQSKCPVSSHLSNWLPIKRGKYFKIATVTCKILATGQPGYLHTLLNIYHPVCSLRSQDNHLLVKPSVYTSTGRRAFSYAARQIWNATPLNIRNSPSVGSFKRNFKNIYFCRSLLFLNLWFPTGHQRLPAPPIRPTDRHWALYSFFALYYCIIGELIGDVNETWRGTDGANVAPAEKHDGMDFSH